MDNMINNSDNNLRKLAKLVAEEIFKLIEIKQLDEIFTNSLNDPYELLIAELARLMTLLASYEESEQYEKAAIIKNKIKIINKKLNND